VQTPVRATRAAAARPLAQARGRAQAHAKDDNKKGLDFTPSKNAVRVRALLAFRVAGARQPVSETVTEKQCTTSISLYCAAKLMSVFVFWGCRSRLRACLHRQGPLLFVYQDAQFVLDLMQANT
jgi:hypothetical protein